MADQVVQSSEPISRIDAGVESDAADASDNSEAGVDQRKQLPKPRRPSFILLLNLILLVVVLMASGLVPFRDVLFAGFASVYFLAFAKLVFPSSTKEHPPNVFPRSRLLRSYIAFAGLISIPMAVAYILGSFVKGDDVAMKAASPHLFLIACQVLSEITVVSLSTPVSIPVRMLVPIFYNTRRLFTIAAWLETEFARTANDIISPRWLLFGRGLAAANMAIWMFNLFCFLLPVYLPLGIKEHNEFERRAKEHQS